MVDQAAGVDLQKILPKRHDLVQQNTEWQMSETVLKEWTSFKQKPPLGPTLMIMRYTPEDELCSEVWLDRFVDEKLLNSWLTFMNDPLNLWWKVFISP